MSTFYLLPPRPVIGDAFAAFLNQFFPGLDWDADMRSNMAHALGEAYDTTDGWMGTQRALLLTIALAQK